MQTMQKLSHFQGNHLPSFVEHPFKFTQIEGKIAYFIVKTEKTETPNRRFLNSFLFFIIKKYPVNNKNKNLEIRRSLQD